MRVIGALVVICLLLLACEQYVPPPREHTPSGGVLPSGTAGGTDGGARPDIPRKNPPRDMPDELVYEQPERPTTPIPVIVPNTTEGLELDIPIGEPIGRYHPFITASRLGTLKHRPVQVTNGGFSGYTELLTFDFGPNSTGRIVFGKDDDTDEIGSFLRFEENRPIFEYSVTLNRGTFESLQGREIQLLGHTYIVAEATNHTVSLFGRDIANNFFFQDGERLVANNSNQRTTVCNVTPYRISYELFTDGDDDGDILLSPGEKLSESAGGSALGRSMIDIKYDGATAIAPATISLRSLRDGYRIGLPLDDGPLNFTLVHRDDNGTLHLGKEGSPLRTSQCSGYCIAPDDTIILVGQSGRTHIVEYQGLQDECVELSDRGHSVRTKFVGDEGRDAWAEVRLDKDIFRVRIGPRDNTTGNANITFDQSYANKMAEIALIDGSLLRIGDVNGTRVPLDITIPRDENRTEQHIQLSLEYAGGSEPWRVVAHTITFFEDEKSHDTFGQTQFGTTVILKRNKDTTLAINEGEDAAVIIPAARAYGTIEIIG